jgi:arylsulfatase A-like enzyme
MNAPRSSGRGSHGRIRIRFSAGLKGGVGRLLRRPRGAGATLSRGAGATLLPALVLLAALCGCERGGGENKTGSAGASGSAPNAPPPNVIFILIDALRADRLGVYGHTGGLSPNLDALAAEGAVFERAIAPAPWTRPAMTSIICSRYPGALQDVKRYRSTQVPSYTKIALTYVIDPAIPTWAEVMKKQGYATAGIQTNPHIAPEFGLDHGFEFYDDSFIKKPTPAHVVNEAGLAWLQKRDPAKPFFLYLHYMDVHGPYDAGPEFLDPLLDAVEQKPDKQRLTGDDIRGLAYLHKPPKGCTDLPRHQRLMQYKEYWIARYEAGLRAFDHDLGGLRTRLAELGLWDHTFVIVTADHGESLGEEGVWDHGYSVHHGELRVPLIMRWPGVLPAGKRSSAIVRTIDIMPTAIAAAHAPPLIGAQGVSLLPLLAGQPADAARTALSEATKRDVEKKALYQGDWKLIYITEPPAYRLYNIAADPRELTDCANTNPTELNRLLALLKEQLADNAARGAKSKSTKTQISPANVQRLKELGYVGDGAADGENTTPAETQPAPATQPGA